MGAVAGGGPAAHAATKIAEMMGCDPRTALRAIVHGIEAIRPIRTRESLRQSVEDARYTLDLSSPDDDEWIAAQARVDQAERASVEAQERGVNLLPPAS